MSTLHILIISWVWLLMLQLVMDYEHWFRLGQATGSDALVVSGVGTSEVEESGNDEQVRQHDGSARHADGGGLGQGLRLHAQAHSRRHARHDTLESSSHISIQSRLVSDVHPVNLFK